VHRYGTNRGYCDKEFEVFGHLGGCAFGRKFSHIYGRASALLEDSNIKKVTVIFIAACLLLPMGAIAGPDCTKHPSHPSCGGDTPLPVTEVDNTAQHSGFIFEGATAPDTIFDPIALPRVCEVEIVQSNKGVVHYECQPGGRVSINFSGWELVTGVQGYCDLLDTLKNPSQQEFREFTPTRYWYRNDSECDRTPGGVCEIRISKISFRGQRRGPGTDTGDTHKYYSLPNPLEDIGRINIRTWAQLVPLEDEGNVFAVSQVMGLQYIEVEFRAVRTGATVAICRVEQGTDYFPEDAQLITTDLP